MDRKWLSYALAATVALSGGVVVVEADSAEDDVSAVVAFDQDGNSVNVGDWSASLLPAFKEEVQQLKAQVDHMAGLARAVDSEGVERPAWIVNQIHGFDAQIARLERAAANMSLDQNGPLFRTLGGTRSTALRSALLAPAGGLSAIGDFASGPAATGGISGQVTAAATGAPIEDILVIAWIYDDGIDVVKRARTGANGEYNFTNLADGDYYIEAVDTAKDATYAAEFYDDLPWKVFTTATEVAVQAGQPVANIDFGLDLSSQITGTVTDAKTGAPVSGAAVYMYMPADARTQEFTIVTSTDSEGRFTSAQLAGSLNAIEHRLWIYAPEGYVDEGYDKVYVRPGPRYNRCTPIDLQPGQTADFAMELIPDTQTAYLTGVVTDRATGELLAGIPVKILDFYSYVEVGSVTTDSTGAYRAGPFWTGIYGLWAKPDPSLGYAWQIYKNRGWGSSFTAVTILPETEKKGLDFQLDRWGGIEGKVKDNATKSPLEGILAGIIYKPVAGDATYFLLFETDQDGAYGNNRLPPQDDYRVYTQNGADFGYVDEMYNNVPCAADECDWLNRDWDWTVGTTIAVGSGQTVRNINLALAKQ
ncbi:MAG: carboxypeptidase regulatory-like domain-containing protein [Acidobacteria bacterium]|nr:carboxypeptidase regulatory-like domain-containing protein [Acidobacteriota bacterium]